MNIQESYNEWSSTYDEDRNFTRDLAGRIIRSTLENRRFQSIIEIGCGTGTNTVFLAQIGAHIHAVDFSEGMLTTARKKVQAPNVTFTVADITRPWPCTECSADIIVCALVLEHIENLSHIFSEAFRCLNTGGQLLISELHPYRQYKGVKAVFERGEQTTEIPAFLHNITDFLDGAVQAGFSKDEFKECWHEHDENKLPRLVSFVFGKP